MRKTFLPIILCLFSLFGVAQAQTTTVGNLTADHVAATPTEGESYYLLSAADQRVPGDPSNGLTADFFPMYEKNFVVYNSSPTSLDTPSTLPSSPIMSNSKSSKSTANPDCSM